MRKYANKKESLKLSKKNKENIEKNLCYNNVFKTYAEDLNVFNKVRADEWVVEYGYVCVTSNIYARHAYFVNQSTQEVIDPTLPLLDSFENRGEIDYIKIHSFNKDEYVEAIIQERNNPALMSYLREKDSLIQKTLTEKGIFCIW